MKARQKKNMEELYHETAVHLIADILTESLKNLQNDELEIKQNIMNRTREYLEVQYANDLKVNHFREGIKTNGSLELEEGNDLKCPDKRNKVKMGRCLRWTLQINGPLGAF